MAAMSPVERYQDPPLSSTTIRPDEPRQNGIENHNNNMFEQDAELSKGHGRNDPGQGAQNEEIPLGPTISYRGVGPNADPRLHRSFSQRAKGRPFADEAYADDSFDEYTPSKPQRTNGRAISATHPAESPLQLNPVTTKEPLPRTPEQRTRMPQRSLSAATNEKPELSTENHLLPVTESVRFTRSNSRKDAGNQTEDLRKKVASDRSPLQTLEVKLTDISKEEKRARVQEAEMRLRETQGSRRPQKVTIQSSRSVSQPLPPSSQGGDTSTRPRVVLVNRREPSRPVEVGSSTDRPKQPRFSKDGPAIDIPVRQYGSAKQRNAVPTSGQYPSTSKPLEALSNMRTEPSRSSSTRQVPDNIRVGTDVTGHIPRSVSLGQKRPDRLMQVNEIPPSDRERSASYQAALQQLTGEPSSVHKAQDAASPPRKSQTTRLKTASTDRPVSEQDSPIGVDIGTLGGEPPRYDNPSSIIPRQSKFSSQSQRSQPVVGLGVRSPPTAQPSNLQTADSVEATKNRQRKSSVSFKEPFDKRRPVDEWKAAETARLIGEDFSSEQATEPETYKAWWEQDQTRKASKRRASNTYGPPGEQIDDQTATFNPPLFLKCGPLLRYTGMKRTKAEAGSSSATKEYWRGTIMIVTKDSQCSYEQIPILRLFSQPKKLLPPPPALVTGEELAPEYIDPIAGLNKLSRTGRALYVRPIDHLEEAKDLSRIEDDNGIYEASPSPLDVNGNKNATSAVTNKRTLDTDGERLGRYKEVKGVRIYADPDRDVTFWRFSIEVELGPEQRHIAYRINKSASVGFWVPAQGQTMNIMFQSCNGFSIAVDPNTFSGPDPLWRDVLNNHQTRPFHVMIGGGDQIYNDKVMVDTKHFGEWTKLKHPHQKYQAPFTPEMKEELESYYLERYSMWFSQGLFGMANASIPMVNIWDDHDIIDGYGSYPDDFMKSPVFTGLGEIAHKYYLLFQHQTIDAMTEKDEPSWVLGPKPGPYIQHVSRSVYLELGKSVAFLGLDGRTERTRHDVISDDTLEAILERCRHDIVEGQTKHLIVLLGVPIAYPRLVWLENVLTSRAIEPIKALHRAGIVKTKLLNRFDGGVEVLDDLDDHWTATHHKVERNILIEDLQDLAAEKSVRITILSGDVHLAAVGQFYSNPKLKIPKDKDHRYMPNVVSSAIVNTPPPDMLADVLNKRNKVHHLNKYTDENMIPMFTHDVDDKKRNNTHLLPRRNWCSIREYVPGSTPPPTPSTSPSVEEADGSYTPDVEGQYQGDRPQPPKRRLSLTKNDFNPRNLMRRLSSRGAPPNSFKAGRDPSQFEQRAASLDGLDQGRLPYRHSPQVRASSADHVPDVPALRPTFHRRPTNLSEKAARKGIVPALDAEGNEIHFNDYVNLEGGLDIVLNCEVNQRDPAGITTQYRLLVPALAYDGSSDREKIDASAVPSRRNTILQRFGLNPRRGNRAADNQGAGNWGQDMSESGSYTESEEEGHEQPKKRFSLFGSLRKKKAPQFDASKIHHPHLTPGQVERNERETPANRELDLSGTQEAANDSQSIDQTSDSVSSEELEQEPRRSQNSHQVAERPPQPTLAATSSRSGTQRSSRPLSYVIGGGSAPPLKSQYSSTQADGRPPYDPDAAYITGQQRSQGDTMQRPNTQGHSAQARNSDSRSLDDEYAQPQQRQLRGNGIIGKNIPPTSYRNSNGNGIGIHYGEAQDAPRGYSGIEAYKEAKPKRRWSLRERARNLRESLGSRRRHENEDDWYSDEDDEEFWERDNAGGNRGPSNTNTARHY